MSNQTFIKKDRISFAVDLNDVLSIAPVNDNTSIYFGPSNIDSNVGILLSNQYIYADGTYLSNLPNGITQSNINSTITGLGTFSYVSSLQLQSTIVGLGNIYVSSAGGGVNQSQLISTVVGLGNIYISTAGGGITQSVINSTIVGLGTTGYISSPQLLSTVAGLGNIYLSTGGNASQTSINSTIVGLATFGYISSSQLFSTVTGLIEPPEFLSTVNGLGTIGYVSSSQLLSTTRGLGNIYLSTNIVPSTIVGLATFGYISSSQLFSTVTGLIEQPELQSTVNGLGNLGYISSSQLLSTTRGLGNIYLSTFTGSTNFLSASQSFISSLTVNGLTIGSGNGFVDFSFIRAILVSSIQTNTGVLFASSITGDGSQIFNLNAVSSQSIQSTIVGLGTFGYISSSQLFSTVTGLIEQPELQSTVNGLGNLGYISSSQLLSTTQGLGNIYLSTNIVPSTIVGLGTFGYISSSQITSTVTGLVDHSELQSTIIGLGTFGYVSSLNFVSSLRISTGSLTASSIVSFNQNVSSLIYSTIQGNILSTNLMLGTTTTQTLNPFTAGSQLGFGSNTAQGGFYAEGHFRSTFTQVIQPTLDNDGFSNVVRVEGTLSTPQIFTSTLNSRTFLSSTTLNLGGGTALLGILNNAVTGRVIVTNLNPIQSSNIEIGANPTSNFFRNVYTFSTTTDVIQGQGATGNTNINSAVRVLGTLSSFNLNVSTLIGINVSSTQFFGSSINTNGVITNSLTTNSIQSFNSTVTSVDTIVPSLDNTFDLGASTNTWRHVFVGGGSIYMKNSSNINAAISFPNDNLLKINKPINLSYSTDTNAEPKIVFSKENTNSITIEATDSSLSNLPPRLLKLNNSIDLSGNNIYNATAYFINDQATLSNYAFSFFSNVSPVNPLVNYPIYATYDVSFNFLGSNAIASDWSYFNASNVLNMCNYYIANLLQTATSHNAATNRIAKKVYFNSVANFTIGIGTFSNVLSVSPVSPILYDNPYTYYNYLNCTVSFRCDGVNDDLAYFLSLSNTGIASDLSGEIFNDSYPYIENKKNFLTSNHSITFQEQFSVSSWYDGQYFIPMLFVKAGTSGGTLSNIKFSMSFEPLIESFIN